MGDCVRDDGLEGSFVGGVDYLKMRGLVNQNGRFPPCVPGQTMTNFGIVCPGTHGGNLVVEIYCSTEVNAMRMKCYGLKLQLKLIPR